MQKVKKNDALKAHNEMPFLEGANSVSIAALDGSHNRSDHVFSIQVAARSARIFSYDTKGKAYVHSSV